MILQAWWRGERSRVIFCRAQHLFVPKMENIGGALSQAVTLTELLQGRLQHILSKRHNSFIKTYNNIFSEEHFFRGRLSSIFGFHHLPLSHHNCLKFS
jgi:hypothetical protein